MDFIIRILPLVQLVLSVLLIVAILLQQRGGGVGGAFGGGSTVYRTKRGVEKKLFHLTIVLGALFAASSLARLLL